jgi:hypothetical protein
LRTVTDTAELVPTLPPESVARAVIETLPSGTEVESQVMEYGAVVSVPTTVEPTRNCTWATPLVSEAVALIGTLVPDTVAPAAGAVTATVGAVVSLRTVTDTAELVPTLPASSVARAVIETLPSGTEVESQVME